MNKKVTNLTIKKMKQEGTPISMITAYDYIMAQNVDEADIDMILVGDSWAMSSWAIHRRCRSPWKI